MYQRQFYVFLLALMYQAAGRVINNIQKQRTKLLLLPKDYPIIGQIWESMLNGTSWE